MQDRPDVTELLEAVAAFIRTEAVPRLSGARRFHGLVAENVVRVVLRQLEHGPEFTVEECERLADLLGDRDRFDAHGASDELERSLAAQLCRRIDDGEADAGPFHDRVVEYLERSLRSRLEIDNPGFDRRRSG